MTLRHLQIFKAVCDTGSMTEAANSLKMTQPSVSIAIGELESFYETKLFERANRRIYLTEEGVALRGYADSILSQIREANVFLRNKANFKRVRLGVSTAVGESILKRLIHRIHLSEPEVELNIVVKNSDDIDHLLSSNQIDLAVFEGIRNTEGREVLRIGTDKPCAFASDKAFPEKSVTLEQLSRMPLCICEKGTSMRTLVEATFAEAGLIPNIVMESVSTFALLQMASSGFGVAVLSEASIEAVSKEHAMHHIKVVDSHPTEPIWLVYQNSKHLTETMKKIIVAMKDKSADED